MVPTFKPRVTREGSWDKPGMRTGLGKSDCPGSQGGSGKRGLLLGGARTQFLSRQICTPGSVRGVPGNRCFYRDKRWGQVLGSEKAFKVRLRGHISSHRDNGRWKMKEIPLLSYQVL